MTRTEITLAGMRFHVRIGILPHERELAQPLEIDLRVRTLADDAAVLDYRALYALVSESVGDAPHEYLETLGEAILERALSQAGASWARVALRKPHVALAGPLAWAEVAMERGSRDG